MKHNLPYILNLPPFTYRGINFSEMKLFNKLLFILKGKFTSFLINKLDKKAFCIAINFLYKDSQIYYEGGEYKKRILNDKVVSYPNKRVLRLVNGYEQTLKKIYESYCLHKINFKKDDLLIDCGANVGELFLATLFFKHNLKYIGFEPDLDTYNCLTENTSFSEVKLFNKALSDEYSKSNFYIDNEGGNSSLIDFGTSKTNIVETLPLDSLNIKERIKLFKVEAEGFEPEVLQGAKNTLPLIDYISVDFGFERGLTQDSTIVDVNKILTQNNFYLVNFSEYRLIGLYQNNLIQK